MNRVAAEPSAIIPAPNPNGIDGFLGTRASLGMDVVLVGLLAVLPLFAWSVYLVRRHRNFVAHKRLQWIIATALLAAIVVFEIDVRLVSDWKLRAAASPWWPAGVLTALGIHLIFAVSTLVLLVWVLWEASRRFPTPPVAGRHSPRHMFMARIAGLDLVLTAITGSFFYWLAFVSR